MCRTPNSGLAIWMFDAHTLGVLMYAFWSWGIWVQDAAAGSPDAFNKPFQYSLPGKEINDNVCVLKLGIWVQDVADIFN